MLTQQFSNPSDRQALILSLAQAEIDLTPSLDLAGITCSMNDNVLIITGQVPSFYHKQLAQSRLIAKLEGIVPLENRLTVNYPE